MKKLGFILFILCSSIFALSLPTSAIAATQKQFNSWNEIIDEMDVILNQSYDVYFSKDVDGAKSLVNKAYYGYYEKHGVERAVMSYISGRRGSTVEYQFAVVKKLMTNDVPNKEVRASLDYLIKMLHEDADQLDGKEESAWGVFIAALVIILREGIEAILVIAAISAYLIRSGNKRLVKTVYANGIAAVIASILAAIAIQYVFNISGANQEILEGSAMLLATVVLFFVSNWMFSKAEAEAWKGYVENKVQTAVATGSGFALGAAAFLAVFREGAETILFYQAMLADVKEHTEMVWYGFGLGSLGLVAIFAIIRYGSLKLPIRPFFIGTSILMYVMAIAFSGGGIKELQEADLIGVTPVDFVQAIPILGIYPTVETLLPQFIMLAIVLLSIVYYKRKNRQTAQVTI